MSNGQSKLVQVCVGMANDQAALKVRAERFGAALDNAPSPQIIPERIASGNEAAMDVDGIF